MTGFPVKSQWRAVARRAAPLLAAAVLAWPVATFGADGGGGWRTVQLGPPIKLAPPTSSGPTSSGESSERPDQETPADANAETGRSGVRVEVDSLSAVDRDSVGLLDESQGGFGVNLWEGSDRAMVERLLPGLPGATSSRLVRSLLVRLLLSRATAPKGDSGGQSLLALRVERLFAAGDVKSAVGLLRVSPPDSGDERLARAEVEGLFFVNDNPGACGKVRSLIRRHKGRYWQQANAFCLALAGEHAKSAMIADILREREADIDPAFFILVDALSGDKEARVESLPDPQGLQLSMMRAANIVLPGDIVNSLRPAVLRAVATSPNAQLKTRLEAAERAMMMGAFAPRQLAELYAAVQFTSDQLANPLAAATAIWGPLGRALLLRNAESREQPTARAEALRQAWGLSREMGGDEILVRASLPVLTTIEPATELVWFAKSAAAALFAAGETERAMAWYAQARQEADSSDEARTAAMALWPLVVLADDSGSVEWSAEHLSAWRDTLKDESDDIARSRTMTLYSLFESLDHPVGAELWSELVGSAGPARTQIPDAALRYALRHASEARRLGETVLFSLLALGENGGAGSDPLTVSTVIATLRRVGLEKEARALALEAAIGAGL